MRDFLLMVRLQEPKPCVTECERQAMLESWKGGFAFSEELRSLLAGKREPDSRYRPWTECVPSTSMPKWRTRPYLMLSLLLLVVATVAVGFSRHRRLLLGGGILCAPFGMLSAPFVPGYWNPNMTSLGIANLEPFLFAAGAGMVAMYCGLWPVRRSLCVRPYSKSRVVRCAGLTTMVVAVAWSVHRGLCHLTDPMPGAVLALALTTGVLICFRRSLWVPVVAGVLGFGICYWLMLVAMAAVFPVFFDDWNPLAQLPVTALGVPTWELLWAGAFGGCWPLFVAYVAGTDVLPRT